jgi:hypothetical protein
VGCIFCAVPINDFKLLSKHINSKKMNPTVIIIIIDDNDKKQPFFTAYPNDLFHEAVS